MSGKSNRTYAVDRGKPPVGTRFEKGKSGNPKGRPKKTKPETDPGKILQSLDNEEIVITIDGKRRSMKMAEFHYWQLFAKAIKGDLKAARVIKNLAVEYSGPEAEGPSEARFIVVPDQPTASSDDATSQCNPISPQRLKSRRRGQRGASEQHVSAGYLFHKVAGEQIAIVVGGRKTKVSYWYAYFQQIYTMALNQDDSAARLLSQLRKQFPGAVLPGRINYYLITEADAML
jgi:predicted DNA-binding ribbon-helix-helix protein